jgi:hypothetical protein
MTAPNAKLEKIKKTISLINRIAGNVITDDHEEMDNLNRALRDLDSHVFELELDLQSATDEDEADLLAA